MRIGGASEHQSTRAPRRTLSRPILRTAFAGSAAALLVVCAGCASSPAPSVRGGTASGAIPDSDAARDPLALGIDERAKAAPPPEGVPAGLGMPLPPEVQAKARRSLEDALAELRAAPLRGADAPAFDPDAAPGVDADARLESMRSYASGRWRRLAGDAAGAEADLKLAARLNPLAPEVWRELGEAQLALGNRAGSTAAFRRALVLEPTDTRSLDVLSRTLLDRRDTRDASVLLVRLLDLDAAGLDPALPTLVTARLGRALLVEGDLTAGAELLARALDLPEEYSESTNYANELALLYRSRGDLWRDVGDARLSLGDAAGADRAYATAGSTPSLNPGAILARRVFAAMRAGRAGDAGRLLIEEYTRAQGRLDDRLTGLVRHVAEHSSAGPALGRALQQAWGALPEPERSQAAAPLARARAASVGVDEGLAILREHLGAAPADEGALSDLVARLDTNDAPRLLEELTGLVRAAPLHEERIARALLRVQPDLAQLLDAFAMLDPALRTRPEAMLLEARLLSTAGRLEESEALLASIDRAWSGAPAAAVAQVQALLRLGRVGEAETLLASLDETADEHLRTAKALALAELGDPDGALSLLEPLLSGADGAGPEDVDRMLLAAQLELLAGRPAAAEAWLSEVIERDPTRDDAYAGLITLHARTGPLPDDARVAEVLRRLRDSIPSSPTLRWLRAQDAAARGQLDAAERQLVDLAEEFPDRPGLVPALVKVWTSGGSTERAESWLRQAAERRPGIRAYTIELARLLSAGGRAQEAVTLLDAALLKMPGDDDISRALEAVLLAMPEGRERAEGLTTARLERAPRTPITLVELAELSIRQREPSKAAAHIAAIRERSRSLPPGPASERLAGIAIGAAQAALAGRLEAVPTLAILNAAQAVLAPIPEPLLLARLQLMGRTGVALEEIIAAADAAAARSAELRVLAYAAPAEELRRLPTDRPPGPARLQDAIAIIAHGCRAHAPPAPQLLAVWVVQTYPVPGVRNQPDHDALAQAMEFVRNADAIDPLLAEFDRVVSARPQNGLGEWAYEWAVIIGRTDRDDLQEWLYRVALRHSPDHIWANNNLGYKLLVKDRQIEEAEAMIARAYRAMNEEVGLEQRASVIDSLGWARYKLGQLHDEIVGPEKMVREGALTLLARAVAIAEKDDQLAVARPIILDHLGDAQWAAGFREQAIDSWARASREATAVLARLDASPGELDSDALEELRTVERAALEKGQAATTDRPPPIARIHAPPAANEPPGAPPEPAPAPSRPPALIQ